MYSSYMTMISIVQNAYLLTLNIDIIYIRIVRYVVLVNIGIFYAFT